MSPLRFPLRPVLAGLLLSAPAWAQLATEIRAESRAGQTFLTWRESGQVGVRYRVYRSETALVDGQQLASADFLGELDDKSSRNQGRSLATGVEHAWILTNGGSELAVDQGLFVYTIERETRRAYYAVTSVLAGVEDLTLRRDANATTHGVFERPAMPLPVLQNRDVEGELWAYWVGDRDTPLQPAFFPWPSKGFNLRYEPGTAAPPRGLVVRLHAAGQTYGQGWPQRFEVPQDVDILALSDLQPYTSYSFWFGAQERLPAPPTADTRVWDYTQQRILWTVEQLLAGSGGALDRERVYAIGGSMGAIGAMYLAGESPETFAAILCRNGLYDLQATDYRNPDLFQELFGGFALDLLTRSGLPILQRTNASFMANRDPRVDWPVVRTINGRNDDTVGWMSAVELFQGLARASRPAVHYFDERTHKPLGYWKGVEQALLKRTFRTRRDRPSLRFDRCSLDDDAGQGARTDGDPIGTLNGYLDYDPENASATPDTLRFDVFLRAAGALDDAPVSSGWAALTPRRTGPFVLAPGDVVRYTLWQGGVLEDEHLLFPDANGLLHTPLVPLTTTTREARFERLASDAVPPLFLGRAARAGDRFQAALHGQAGEPWTLYLALGNAHGVTGERLGLDLFAFSGVFDADGRAEQWLDLPATLPANTWIHGRARLTGGLTPLVSVGLQSGP